MALDKNFDYRLNTRLLTTEQLTALGSLVVESSLCEMFLERFIWDLARMKEQQGKFFTSGLQLMSRIELMKDLALPLLRSRKKRTELTHLVSQLKEAINERNIIVHGEWKTDGTHLERVVKEGADKHGPAVVHKRRARTEPLTRTAASIEKVALDLARLTLELAAFSPAWRRGPRLQRSPEQLVALLQKSVHAPLKPPAPQPQDRSSRD